MGFIWGLLIVLAAFLWVVTVFDLVKRHLGAGKTAAWAVIVLVLPFVGAIAYWTLRRAPAEEVQRQMDTQADVRHGAPPPRVGS